MIPILYEKNEKEFNTLGIGALMDSINPIVTEERNGLFYLEMDYPVDGVLYDELKSERIIVADASKDLRNQRFVVTRVTRPIDGIFGVYAEHISQYKTQNTNVTEGTKFNGDANQALYKWNESLIDGGEFTTFSDITHFQKDVNWSVQKVQNARQALGGVSGSILDLYGGEYKFNNMHVGLYQHRGKDRGVTVNYGYNLTDYWDDEDISSTVTSVYPYAVINESLEEEPKIITLPEKVIHSDKAGLYTNSKIITKDFSGDDVTDISTLRKKVQGYVNSNVKGLPKTSIKVSYIDLSQTLNYADEKHLETDVRLCDMLTVNLTKYNVKNLKMKIVELKWNVIEERVESARLGSLSTRFSSNVLKDDEYREIIGVIEKVKKGTNKESIVAIARKEATEMIKRGVGGYVRYQSDRVLIMDTDDEETAQNVWQFNKNGIGHSKNGVNGNYVYAWTINGGFNTDFIATNSITADKLASDVGQGLELSSNEYIQNIVQTNSNIETQLQEYRSNLSNELNNKADKSTVEEMNTELINSIQENSSKIIQTEDSFTQTYERLQANVTNNQVELEKLTAVIQSGMDENGNAYTDWIGNEDNKVRVGSDGIVMYSDNTETMKLKDGAGYMDSLYVTNRLGLGNHTAQKMGTTFTVIVPTGGHNG